MKNNKYKNGSYPKEEPTEDSLTLEKDTAKLQFFQKRLLQWYNLYGRMFSWRKEGLSNYEYIIAEVLLQRTKAETVAKLYDKFILDFPNWQSIVNADLESIKKYMRPIGLYTQRSSRLKNLAIEMIKRNEKLPIKREDLETIPFMGQYMTNAVELIIFKKPSPLMDVNMARVLERFFEKRKLVDIRYDPFLQQLAYKVVNHKKAKQINWAILDFAALVCLNKNPKCSSCLLRSKCSYYAFNKS